VGGNSSASNNQPLILVAMPYTWRNTLSFIREIAARANAATKQKRNNISVEFF